MKITKRHLRRKIRKMLLENLSHAKKLGDLLNDPNQEFVFQGMELGETLGMLEYKVSRDEAAELKQIGITLVKYIITPLDPALMDYLRNLPDLEKDMTSLEGMDVEWLEYADGTGGDMIVQLVEMEK